MNFSSIIKWILMILLMKESWSNFTPATLMNILNSASEDAIIYAGKQINVSEFYAAFPACASLCTKNLPCAAASPTTTTVCAANLSFVDATYQLSNQRLTYPYCNIGTVCCHPEVCRPRALNCYYDFMTLGKELDSTLPINISQDLDDLQDIAEKDTITNMMNYIADESCHDTACIQRCNGWIYKNPGDLNAQDCPSLCKCSNTVQAQLAPGGKYICEQNSSTSSSSSSSTYIQTYPNLTDQTLEVCPINSTCTNSTQCENFSTYQARNPYASIPTYPELCQINSFSLTSPVYSSGDATLMDGTLKICPLGYTCRFPTLCENYDTYQAKVEAAAIAQQKTISKADTPNGVSASTSTSLSTGAKAGIAIGAVLGASVLVLVAVFLLRKKAKKEDHQVEDHYTPML